MKKTRYLLSHYPLSLLCLSLVWYLSFFFLPPDTPLNNVAFIDKWTHFVMYGGTCGVIWWEYLRCHKTLDGWKLLMLAVLGPIVMGGVIELMQKYCTTNRSGEWLDFLADSIGVVLGALFGLAVYRFKKR